MATRFEWIKKNGDVLEPYELVKWEGGQLLPYQLVKADTDVTPPDPDPPQINRLQNNYYGACPHNGASAASVITKFGVGASIRWFDGNRGFSAIPTRPESCSVFHASWKPLSGTITASNIISACRNLVDFDVIEIFHEHDNDGTTMASRITQKEQFHNLVVQLREAGDIPNLLTCCTFTGYAFATENSKDPAFAYAEADILGSDWDGIDSKPYQSFSGAGYPTNNPIYYDFFAHEYAETVAFKNRMGYRAWAIPEFGSFRSQAFSGVNSSGATVSASGLDANGVVRVAWMADQARKIDAAADKPYFTMVFDFANRPTITPQPHLECLELPNEINFWRDLVAKNPA